jgi:hypothetical protein
MCHVVSYSRVFGGANVGVNTNTKDCRMPIQLRDFQFSMSDAQSWDESDPKLRRLNWPAEVDGGHALVQVGTKALERLSGDTVGVDSGKARRLLLAHREAIQAAASAKYQDGDKVVVLDVADFSAPSDGRTRAGQEKPRR